MNSFKTIDDIEVICELLNLSNADFALQIGVTPDTVTRWRKGKKGISPDNLNKIYDFAFSSGIRLNKIKEQLYREDLIDDNHIILFHGAKNTIEGNILIEKSKPGNDFGAGFYCGESLEQSAMFVSGYPNSSLYIADFDRSGLSSATYFVDRDWMLTIAFFRGRLSTYSEHPIIRKILEKAENVDYIVAPIADNRMFEIIDSFIDGEITDVQCQHCLSATNLGNQYVFKSKKAIEHLTLKRQCYLSNKEKLFYLTSRQEETRIGNDKVKIARKQYRNQGEYIEDILG